MARTEHGTLEQDIDFGHTFGNPLFAVETNLGPLERAIEKLHTDEALDILKDIRTSVERMKTALKDHAS